MINVGLKNHIKGEKSVESIRFLMISNDEWFNQDW